MVPTRHSLPIRDGDFVLLDIWAKKDIPNAVYYDITWTGFVGNAPSDHMQEIFEVVRDARNAGINSCRSPSQPASKFPAIKWMIQYGKALPKLDSVTTLFIAQDTPSAPKFTPMAPTWITLKYTMSAVFCRTVVFRLSPAMYLPEFGVRSEVNMLVRSKGAEVTGRMQNEIVII